MSSGRTSDISETKCLTESGDNTIFTIATMDIGKDSVIGGVLPEKIIELCRDIKHVIRMSGFSDKTLESFTTSEADRAFGGDAASEESDVHNSFYDNTKYKIQKTK